MATATNLSDRFDSARERIDEEIQRVQRELQARRKRIEKQLTHGRKSIEKQTRRQVQHLRESELVQQFERLRVEANQQLGNAIEAVLGVLQIASKGDVERIEKKLSKINKRLKEMEGARRSNGQPPAHLSSV
jgi:hypothetical protein